MANPTRVIKFYGWTPPSFWKLEVWEGDLSEMPDHMANIGVQSLSQCMIPASDRVMEVIKERSLNCLPIARSSLWRPHSPQSISVPPCLPPWLPCDHRAVPAPHPSLLWPILCLALSQHWQLFCLPGDVGAAWAAYAGISWTFYPLARYVGDVLFES